LIKTIPIQKYDEAWWIGRSFFFELYINKDFKNPLWQGYFGYDQPKLTEYVFGAILYPKYHQAKKNIKDYNFNKYLIDNNFFEYENQLYINYQQNRKDFVNWENYSGNPKQLLTLFNSHITKTLDIIYEIRTINAIFLSLTIIGIYYISTQLMLPILLALFLSLSFGLNRLVINTGLVALSDPLFQLLFYAGIGTLIVMVKKNSMLKFSRKSVLQLMIFSLITALCISTKLTGLIILMLFNVTLFVKLFLSIAQHQYKNSIIYGYALIIVNILCFCLVVILDPYLYANPIKNWLYMFQYRSSVSDWQMKTFGPALYSIRDRLEVIYTNFFQKKSNIFNLLSFISYEHIIINWLYLISFLVGIISVFKRAFQKTRNHMDNYIVLYLISVLITSLFYLKLDWDRYYLPFVYFIFYFEIKGVYFCWTKLNKILSKKLSLLVF